MGDEKMSSEKSVNEEDGVLKYISIIQELTGV